MQNMPTFNGKPDTHTSLAVSGTPISDLRQVRMSDRPRPVRLEVRVALAVQDCDCLLQRSCRQNILRVREEGVMINDSLTHVSQALPAESNAEAESSITDGGITQEALLGM